MTKVTFLGRFPRCLKGSASGAMLQLLSLAEGYIQLAVHMHGIERCMLCCHPAWTRMMPSRASDHTSFGLGVSVRNLCPPVCSDGEAASEGGCKDSCLWAKHSLFLSWKKSRALQPNRLWKSCWGNYGGLTVLPQFSQFKTSIKVNVNDCLWLEIQQYGLEEWLIQTSKQAGSRTVPLASRELCASCRCEFGAVAFDAKPKPNKKWKKKKQWGGFP